MVGVQGSGGRVDYSKCSLSFNNFDLNIAACDTIIQFNLFYQRCACVCMFMCTCVCIHNYACACACMHACVYVCMCVYVCVCICVCVHVHTCVCVCARMCACVGMDICLEHHRNYYCIGISVLCSVNDGWIKM